MYVLEKMVDWHSLIHKYQQITIRKEMPSIQNHQQGNAPWIKPHGGKCPAG